MSIRRSIAVSTVCLVALAACGSDDESGSDDGFDCETGLELSETFAELTASSEPPSSEALERVREDLDDWNAPADLDDEVAAVKDGLDVFIAQLNEGVPDADALNAAGASLSEAGRSIDAYLAENC